MNTGGKVNELLNQLFDHRISRRGFMKALGVAGVSAAGISSMVKGAQAVEKGIAPLKARQFTGTGGQLAVEQMKAAGVKYLFANPGTYEYGLLDGFLDQPMNLILCMHEGIVISAADGYAKVSRDPGFVLVHVAATAQTLGQLYNSHVDGTPMVVFSGMRENESQNDEYVLAARPGWSLKEMTRQFTKISWETRDAKALPTQVRRAYKLAATEPGGPVYLAISEDAQTRRNVTASIYDRDNFIIPNHMAPDPDTVKEAAIALLSAKAPVMWLGDQVTKDNACAEALELAELLSIPACDYPLPSAPNNDPALETTFPVGSVYANFPHRHPLYGGLYTGAGKDLVLALGFIHILPGFYRFGLAENTPMICCSTSGDYMGRVFPFAIAAVANTKLFLRALIDTIKSVATESRIRQIASGRIGQAPDYGNKAAKLKRENTGLTPIHPDELAAVMDEELDKNCILVHEYHQSSQQFFTVGHREKEKMWISSRGLCLGWGVGASLGAKIAAPDRQVVLDIGDGATMFSSAGFWSMARYQTPVLTIVSNNHCYETVHKAFAAFDGRMKAANRCLGTVLDHPLVDFVGLVKSQGCDGIRVERPADLRAALRRGIEATRSGTPFLIDVDIARQGAGADSKWFQPMSAAKAGKKKA